MNGCVARVKGLLSLALSSRGGEGKSTGAPLAVSAWCASEDAAACTHFTDASTERAASEYRVGDRLPC